MKVENASALFTPDTPGVEPTVDQDVDTIAPSDGSSAALPEYHSAATTRAGHVPGDAPQPLQRGARRSELLPILERLERTLDKMRGGLDATVRENRNREFSLARLVGAIVQILVVGLELWALSDWVFGELGQVLVKLSFAGVLQLGALTAFLLSRDSGRS